MSESFVGAPEKSDTERSRGGEGRQERSARALVIFAGGQFWRGRRDSLRPRHKSRYVRYAALTFAAPHDTMLA